MTVKRIVSFLPSATELLYEFGVQDDLYGVTHECKYPKDAKLKPKVINSVINSDELSSKEIDTVICQLLKDGKNIFALNEDGLYSDLKSKKLIEDKENLELENQKLNNKIDEMEEVITDLYEQVDNLNNTVEELKKIVNELLNK